MSAKFLLGAVCGTGFYLTGYIVSNKCIYEKKNSITTEGDKLKSIINTEHQKLISDLDTICVKLEKVDENLQETIKSCKE